MGVLQMALDARPAAYRDAAAVDDLAALLGLAGRSKEVHAADYMGPKHRQDVQAMLLTLVIRH